MYKLATICSQFEKHAQAALDLWRVPGMAVALVQRDQLVYANGLGVKQIGTDSAVDKQTIFQIGSLSKSFTATLVAMLVEEGKLAWSDKVTKYIPDFRLHDNTATHRFTVQDLLTQHSGLPPHAGHLLPHLGYTRASIIKRLRYIKPSGNFGKDYSYQNHFYLVAAAIIEQCTQQSYEDNLNNRIFTPLQMSASSATLQGYRDAKNVAHNHYYLGPSLKSPIKAIPLAWRHHQWVYNLCPAAGVNSNILDMANWLKLHLNQGRYGQQQLLSPKHIYLLQDPKVRAKPEPWEDSRHYCLGWVHSRYGSQPLVWHNGGTSGMKNVICLLPKVGLGVVILSNLYHTYLPEALARTMLDLYLGNPVKDWVGMLYKYQRGQVELLQPPPGPINPARPLQYYTGTYVNKVYGRMTVYRAKDKLKVCLGPKKVILTLKHWGGDTFIVHWPGVITTGAGVQFLSNQLGFVNGVTVQGMNDDIDGSFNKII